MILISMVFWEPDGTMIYAADPSSYTLLPDNSNYMDQYTEDPTYFNSLVNRVHSIAAPLGINVCLDLFPIKDGTRTARQYGYADGEHHLPCRGG